MEGGEFMSFKEILAVVGVMALGIWAFFYAASNQEKEQEPSLSSPTQIQDQSMASHHGAAQSVNSTLFEGLVGKTAPDFTLLGSDGKEITLSRLKGKNVVLFFNEGLMCYPACWNQIAAFGTDERFKNDKVMALSIVNDPNKDWAGAVVKMPQLGSATVLFDTNREVSKIYGVLTLPSSMHRGQFAGHSYVVIDREGVVRSVKDDPQMALRNDELVSGVAKL